MEDKILYNIKSLEKLIARYLLLNEEQKKNVPTPTQIQIIEYLVKNQDKEVFQKDLEEVLNLRRATVSGVLQTMEKNKLIDRVVSNYDSRVKRIILNENTKQLFLEKHNDLLKIEKLITSGISKNDLDTFNRVISSMKNNLKEGMIKDDKTI